MPARSCPTDGWLMDATAVLPAHPCLPAAGSRSYNPRQGMVVGMLLTGGAALTHVVQVSAGACG